VETYHFVEQRQSYGMRARRRRPSSLQLARLRDAAAAHASGGSRCCAPLDEARDQHGSGDKTAGKRVGPDWPGCV
jgi:hypothetical protein